MTFDPTYIDVSRVTLNKDHCVQLPGNTTKYVDTVTIFHKLDQKGQ